MLLWKAWSRDEFNSDYSLSWQQDTRTGKDGAFRFPPCPGKSYRVRAESDEKSLYAAADSPDLQGEAG